MHVKQPRPFALLVVCCLALALCPGTVTATDQIRYGARLTDDAGFPLSGSHALSFAIHDVVSGGVPCWSESHPSVALNDGRVELSLGSVTPIDSIVLTDDDPQCAGTDRWLELTVDGVVLTPRQPLVAVPHAMTAERLGTKTLSELEADADAVHVLKAGDTMTGPLTIDNPTGSSLLVPRGSMSLGYTTNDGALVVDGDGTSVSAISGYGQNGPTYGVLGVQGFTSFLGVSTVNWAGQEIGVAGISTGGSVTDNYGVVGHSNLVGVRGEHAAAPASDYGELGLSGVGVRAAGTTLAADLIGNVAISGTLDMGPGAADDLTASDVSTLTGGGVADSLHSHAATSDPGVGLEIKQDCAVNTGCFAGDAALFPVRITASGRYFLSSNLEVPVDTAGIEIANNLDNVTIELNGFSMLGGGGTAGSARGISSLSGHENIIVRNGVVRNFASVGVLLSQTDRCLVEDLIVMNNGDNGVVVGEQCIVRDVVADGNAETGIAAGGGSLVIDSIAAGNGTGISLGVGNSVGAIVRDCVARNNSGIGIDLFLGSRHRATGNHVTQNSTGLRALTNGNHFVYANTATGNTLNDYQIETGNEAGPIGQLATVTSPWANITD